MPGMFERLSVTLWTRPGGSMILNATAYVIASASSFKTNEHGYSVATIVLDLSYSRAMWLRGQLGGAHLVIHDGATCRWEGRIEDRRVDGDSLTLTAYGYQRALWDLPYTAPWSSTSVGEWSEIDESQIPADATPKRFSFDTNNQLYIAAQKNSIQGSARMGYLGFKVPAGSSRQIVTLSFDYVWSNAVGWQWGVQARTSSWAFTANLDTTAGGTTASGSKSLSFSGTDAIVIFFRFNGVDTPYGSETGDQYLRITNVRIKTTTSAAVYADEIARHIVTTVNGNGGLGTSTSRIQSPLLDLRDEIYIDANMADVLSYLVKLGDNQSPPRQWEWGVWEERALALRPRGSVGRTWYVTVPDPTVEDTLDTLVNSVTPILKDANGDRVVGTTASDAASIARFGLTRRQHLSMDTTSSTEAATRANARLNDGKDPAPSVAIPIDTVRDVNGGNRPRYELRSGDTIVIQNLPPNLSTDVDRLRILRLSETTYFLDGRATVTPEQPLPSLEVLLARRAAGV